MAVKTRTLEELYRARPLAAAGAEAVVIASQNGETGAAKLKDVTAGRAGLLAAARRISVASHDGSGAGDAEEFDGGADVTLRLPASIKADVTGDVTGNLTGDVTGNLTGDVTGNLTGNADTATDAGYAARIGTAAGHPAVGSAGVPVYVDADGAVRECSVPQITGCPFPVGSVYTQYPQCAAPADLWTGTEWERLDFGGAFFRGDGGDALPFNGGRQGEGLPNITGFNYVLAHGSNSNGAFHSGANTNNVWINAGGRNTEFGSLPIDFNAGWSNGIYGASAHVTPVNYTVRVWRRTA